MSLTMVFTAGQCVEGGVLCASDVYVGEFAATFKDCPVDEIYDDATCVTIKEGIGLTLEKLHQPDKGTPAVGSFSVGTVVWTPVP